MLIRIAPVVRVALGAAILTTVTAGQAGLPLLNEANLRYEGAFRLPAPTGPGEMHTFGYGGTALGFDPARQSLWLTGHDWHQRIAEVGIPTPSLETEVAKLPRAEMRTTWMDTAWRAQVGGDPGNLKIGGILPLADGTKVVSVFTYYDAGGEQRLSHFRLSAAGEVIGKPSIVGSEGAGLVARYMTPIPAEWQARFGGTHLTGNSTIPIISRTSLGPALSVFDPTKVGAPKVPAVPVVGYPLGRWRLGSCEEGKTVNCTTNIGGVAFPDGTSSVLFFLHTGTGPVCYKDSGPPPCRGTGGYHAPPYATQVFAYNAEDLVAVRQRRKSPWDIAPYAIWDLPYGGDPILGVAYDPGAKRVFLSLYHHDGTQPLIRVFAVTPAPTPRTPAR